MNEPTWPWRIAAAVILTLTTGLVAAGIGMLGFHVRIWVEAGQCDRSLTYPVVIERGESSDLYGEGMAQVTVERTTVYCVTYDGRA